jgi:hypothetical protein
VTHARPALEFVVDTYLLELHRLQNKILQTIWNFPRCIPVSDLHTTLNLPHVRNYVVGAYHNASPGQKPISGRRQSEASARQSAQTTAPPMPVGPDTASNSGQRCRPHGPHRTRALVSQSERSELLLLGGSIWRSGAHTAIANLLVETPPIVSGNGRLDPWEALRSARSHLARLATRHGGPPSLTQASPMRPELRRHYRKFMWLSLQIPEPISHNITKLCRQQAEAIQHHEKKHVLSIGQGESRHR